MWGYSEHPRSIKKMGALKAPKVSKIERIVCWCHFTRLLKLDKVSYFKIFNVINKKAEKTAFLFRIAPPHPTAVTFCGFFSCFLQLFSAVQADTSISLLQLLDTSISLLQFLSAVTVITLILLQLLSHP